MKKFLVVMAVLLAGCAHKQIKSEPISQPIETKVIETPILEGTIPTTPVQKKHTVVKGECLWKISAKEYNDPFQWPLIFMDNRDQIKNADIIEIGQVFNIESNVPDELVKEVRKMASAEPPYSSHRSKPKQAKHKVQ